MSWEALDDRDKASQGHDASPTLASFSDNVHTVVGEVESNRRALKSARAALGRAQKDTQDSFRRYKACLDIEAQALQQVSAAEERRDALMASLVDACRVEGSEASETSSRKSFAPEDTRPSTGTHVESRSSPKQIHDQIPCSYKNNGAGVQEAVNGWRAMRDMQWSTPDVTGMTVSSAGVATVPYQPDMQMDVQEAQSRKHSRSWDIVQGQTEIEEFSSIPPRKRYQLEDDPTMAASRSTLTMRRSSFPAMQSQGMGHLEQVMVTHA
ncbi:hypothetical protein EW026_g1686 [Hermanssonia centrifuga]|uniref:Uncharacterized protein n=1 Tax=Hermanssonia centrifuga TaxID=98765 RepID=A0A4S4KQP8_9APHY|nr:hypothetical protein EW026_g1686 [Hermanssonia centrifuga]